MEQSNKNVEIYNEKLQKIETYKNKYNQQLLESKVDQNGKSYQYVVELVDNQGERKFVKTKAEQ